jgi:hypothetical protein
MRTKFLLPLVLCMVMLILPRESMADAPVEPNQTEHKTILPLVSIATPNTTSNLIEQALARGEIDTDTAWIYHIYSVFGDARLPKQYVGNGEVSTDIIAKLEANYNTLSVNAKNALAPFTIPPYHTGSWWHQRTQPRSSATGETPYCDTNLAISTEWEYLDTPNKQIRIWWQKQYAEDKIKAQQLASQANEIWAALNTLMQRTPPSDQGSSIFCRGNSNHYDISLVDIATSGETYRYNLNTQASPSYILLNRDASEADLIHNLMHAFQYSYDVAGSLYEYNWWREATAEWAIHYVRPNLNAEHASAQFMMQHPATELESLDAKHQYGAYLFALFLQLHTGSADVIRSTFEKFQTEKDSLIALNAVIPGGFKETWHKFAVQTVNRGSVNLFEQADQLTERGAFLEDIVVGLHGDTERVFELPGDVKHLASHPYRFVFNDSSIRSVSVINPMFVHYQETAQIQVIAKVNGTWRQPEDILYTPTASYCRDLKSERLEELIVVFSNHEWKERQLSLSMPNKPFLAVSNVGCGDWTFEVKREVTVTGPEHNYTEKATVIGTWKPRPQQQVGEFLKPSKNYYADQITATWEHNGTKGNCSAQGTGSFNLWAGGGTYLDIGLMPVQDATGRYIPGQRLYYGNGYHASDPNVRDDYAKITYNCTAEEPFVFGIHAVNDWLIMEQPPSQIIHSNGREIVGEYTQTTTQNEHTRVDKYMWTMNAKPAE